MYRSRPFLIGKRINLHLISNHERRIESQTEMSDHIILCSLVLIFLKELCRAGKCDLSDIFLHFIRCHTKTIIDKLHRLLFRIDDHFNLRLISLREFILSHHVQFFQLCDRVASIGYHLTYKNIMIRIHPFLYDRKYILAVNG